VRLFGTNGIREVVGTKLAAPFVTSVAYGIAKVAEPGRPIVVGWDGRTSSPALARLMSATLALGGHRVVEVGLLPTPAVQYNVTRLGAQMGVILTASQIRPSSTGSSASPRTGSRSSGASKSGSKPPSPPAKAGAPRTTRSGRSGPTRSGGTGTSRAS